MTVLSDPVAPVIWNKPLDTYRSSVPAGTFTCQSSGEPPAVSGGVNTLFVKSYTPSSLSGLVGTVVFLRNTCAKCRVSPSPPTGPGPPVGPGPPAGPVPPSSPVPDITTADENSLVGIVSASVFEDAIAALTHKNSPAAMTGTAVVHPFSVPPERTCVENVQVNVPLNADGGVLLLVFLLNKEIVC